MRVGGIGDPVGRRGWARAGLVHVGGGEGHGDHKGLEHDGGRGADRAVDHAVGHVVGRVVGHVVGHVVGRVVGRVVDRAATGVLGVEGAGGMSGCPDGCNYMASSSSLGCCGPSATGGGTGWDMRVIAQDTGAIGPGTLGPAAGAGGTGAIARDSGETGIRSASGVIGVADTVPGAEEAVPNTAREECSPDGRTAKVGSGHVSEDPEYLPGVRVGEAADSQEPVQVGSGYNLWSQRSRCIPHHLIPMLEGTGYCPAIPSGIPA